MNHYKYYFHKLLSSFGEDYKLSKTADTYLNILVVQCAQVIIHKINDLVHPLNPQHITRFRPNTITPEDVRDSILALFPKKISKYVIKECDRILRKYHKQNIKKQVNPKKIELNIPFATAQVLLQNNLYHKVSFDEPSAVYLSVCLEMFMKEILKLTVLHNKNSRLFYKKSIKHGISMSKDYQKIVNSFQILSYS